MAPKEVGTFTDLADNAKDAASFWEAYSKGRPSFPASFWRRLVDYHTQHGNKYFSHVHDLGAGPGVHALVLAKHFDHVTVTNPNEKSVTAARTILSQQPDAKRYSCQTGRGEDSIKPEDVGTYDMLFLGNALHCMDLKPSIANIATSLRDGGTFAAAIFGFPDITDRDALKAIQAWFRHGIDMMVAKGGPPNLGDSIVSQNSNYDSVVMDTSVWRDVTRVKLNLAGVASRRFTTESIRDKYFSGKDVEVSEAEDVKHEDDGGGMSVPIWLGFVRLSARFLCRLPRMERRSCGVVWTGFMRRNQLKLDTE